MTEELWPVAELDTVRRLEVLAASMPGAMYAEEVVAAPFDTVWEVVEDMDSELPRLLPNFRSWRTLSRDGERLRAEARGYLGLRSGFDVVLRPGWCLMQDARVMGGMAASPGVGGTRFAVMAAPRGSGRGVLGPLLRPLHPVVAGRILRRLRDRVAERSG
ncbi:hypothetical protein [Actinopolymorpha alba]|uniref:hypothetical protein n=1 Tax=Actinopolymorpha alba TaxID=533267 RepID=UPI000382321C|nr:hypothetical protein [Actinopolymorpha alba]